MICPACGYAMDSFDKECPRCHGKGISQQSASAITPPVQNTDAQSIIPQTSQQSPSVPDRVSTANQSQPYNAHNNQLPQPIVVQTNVRGGGFMNGLGGGTGAALGVCCLAPFLILMFFMVIGGLTVAGKNQSDNEKAAARESIVLSSTTANITSTGSEYWKQNTITVTGNVKNNAAVEQSVQMEARIYNNSNVLVASGIGYETIPAGETKLFNIRVSDDTQTSPFTYKVIVKK